MNKDTNTRKFVADVLNTLERHGITVRLFGGWAEELLELTQPRQHGDLDLLYINDNFDKLDAVIAVESEWEEIILKRFPHKRAVTFKGVMIEFILVQKIEYEYHTIFFDRYHYVWPDDTFDTQVILYNKSIRVTSTQALHAYRAGHDAVRKAYRDYVARTSVSSTS